MDISVLVVFEGFCEQNKIKWLIFCFKKHFVNESKVLNSI